MLNTIVVVVVVVALCVCVCVRARACVCQCVCVLTKGPYTRVRLSLGPGPYVSGPYVCSSFFRHAWRRRSRLATGLLIMAQMNGLCRDEDIQTL